MDNGLWVSAAIALGGAVLALAVFPLRAKPRAEGKVTPVESRAEGEENERVA